MARLMGQDSTEIIRPSHITAKPTPRKTIGDSGVPAMRSPRARAGGPELRNNRRRGKVVNPRGPVPYRRAIPGQPPVDESMVGYGEPARELRFDKNMPGEYDGPNQMLGQLGPEGAYAGPRRPAPSAPLQDRFGGPTIPQGAPRLSGPTRGNVEDFMGENAGLHVRGGQNVEGPRILNRTPMSAYEQGPITPRENLTNLSGERMQAGFRGDLPDTQFDFTAQGGRKRPADRLDVGQNSAIYTDPQGNSRNTTDAYYEDRMAESKHRMAMTREAGRASERAGDGQVRTLGQGRSTGLYGALARMGGKKRSRVLGQRDRALDIKERANELDVRKANMPPSIHPLEARKLQAETAKLGVEALNMQTPKEKQLFEEKMAKDKGLLDLYKELGKAVTKPQQQNLYRMIESYKTNKAFELYVRPESK